MGNSLMLKDGAGRLAGYIQSVGGVIRCKLLHNAHAEQALVTLLFEDGHAERLEAALNGTEAEHGTRGGRLTGAYAVAGERLLCATDEDARRAGLRELSERVRAQTAVRSAARADTRKTEPPRGEERAVVKDEQPAPRNAAFPEQRWPPPPCCPKAKYERGKWIIQDERMSDAKPGHDET